MGVVVLVGFSCSGKSSAARPFEGKPEIEVVDTDTWISQRLGVKHIYEVFFEYQRDEALAKIEEGERAFLSAWTPSTSATLIAAGPFVPTRSPEWQSFVKRVRPECVWLTVTEEEAFDSLTERRSGHVADGIGDEPRFSSWDQDVTTERTAEGWRPVSRQFALENIRGLLARLSPAYASAIKYNSARKLHRSGGEEVRARISELLSRERG